MGTQAWKVACSCSLSPSGRYNTRATVHACTIGRHSLRLSCRHVSVHGGMRLTHARHPLMQTNHCSQPQAHPVDLLRPARTRLCDARFRNARRFGCRAKALCATASCLACCMGCNAATAAAGGPAARCFPAGRHALRRPLVGHHHHRCSRSPGGRQRDMPAARTATCIIHGPRDMRRHHCHDEATEAAVFAIGRPVHSALAMMIVGQVRESGSEGADCLHDPCISCGIVCVLLGRLCRKGAARQPHASMNPASPCQLPPARATAINDAWPLMQ